jgi:hypothetical protein
MEECVIHIQWTGPHFLAEVAAMTGPTDKGLYQVYAHHPIYGRNLVYLGKTDGASFGARIAQHSWEGGAENDPNRVEYYVGRLKGAATPSPEQWAQEITLAEALLIHSHGPAYNSQYVKEAPPQATHGHVRVLNWGAVRALHREVSGLMWSPRAEQSKRYEVYGAASAKT